MKPIRPQTRLLLSSCAITVLLWNVNELTIYFLIRIAYYVFMKQVYQPLLSGGKHGSECLQGRSQRASLCPGESGKVRQNQGTRDKSEIHLFQLWQSGGLRAQSLQPYAAG